MGQRLHNIDSCLEKIITHPLLREAASAATATIIAVRLTDEKGRIDSTTSKEYIAAAGSQCLGSRTSRGTSGGIDGVTGEL